MVKAQGWQGRGQLPPLVGGILPQSHVWQRRGHTTVKAIHKLATQAVLLLESLLWLPGAPREVSFKALHSDSVSGGLPQGGAKPGCPLGLPPTAERWKQVLESR